MSSNILLTVVMLAMIMCGLRVWAGYVAKKDVMRFVDLETKVSPLVRLDEQGKLTLVGVGMSNWLSFFRFAAGPTVFVIYCAQLFGEYSNLAALILLVVGASTDAFDGPIARSRNETTLFGQEFDPAADKSIQYFPVAGMILYLLRANMFAELFPGVVWLGLIVIVLRDLVLLLVWRITKVKQKPAFISKARSAVLAMIGVEIALIATGVNVKYLTPQVVALTIYVDALLSVVSMIVETVRMLRTEGSAV